MTFTFAIIQSLSNLTHTLKYITISPRFGDYNVFQAHQSYHLYKNNISHFYYVVLYAFFLDFTSHRLKKMFSSEKKMTSLSLWLHLLRILINNYLPNHAKAVVELKLCREGRRRQLQTVSQERETDLILPKLSYMPNLHTYIPKAWYSDHL